MLGCYRPEPNTASSTRFIYLFFLVLYLDTPNISTAVISCPITRLIESKQTALLFVASYWRQNDDNTDLSNDWLFQLYTDGMEL